MDDIGIDTTAMYTAKQILRFISCMVNNVYCVPTYFLWLLVLQPFRILWPSFFWSCEHLMFRFLLACIASWQWSVGYDILESGENPSLYEEDESIVIANHQSTADVPVLFQCFTAKHSVINGVMWIMDAMFKYTHFGLVSLVHGDIFIQQGKESREQQLKYLEECLKREYWSRNRKWIILFPEGGFLYKRLENSQRFAKKNNLPVLQHVTLPRVGALEVLLKVLTKDKENSSDSINKVKSDLPGKPLKWLIDITIGYADNRALDLVTIMTASRPPCTTELHYRCYPIDEIPKDTEGLTNWMYERFTEKDNLLKHFYKTGSFPSDSKNRRPQKLQFSGIYFLFINLFFLFSFYLHYYWISTVLGILF